MLARVFAARTWVAAGPRSRVVMVEGPLVHRLAIEHRRLLLGLALEATSPSGRFADGAAAVNGHTLTHIEPHGKNIFYFFTPQKVEVEGVLEKVGDDVVVVHIHFGMSGSFRTYYFPGPEPREATRLQLQNEDAGLVAHLSASVCVHGDMELYRNRILELGPDPLREDADKEVVWASMQKTKRSIGALLMDQSLVAGIGNIYRSELLLVVGLHPEQPANSVSRAKFEFLWDQAVRLMKLGVQTGAIVITLPGKPFPKKRGDRMRYVYNQKACGICGGVVKTWTMAQRTVYACEACQPPPPIIVTSSKGVSVSRKKGVAVCSPDAADDNDTSDVEIDTTSVKAASKKKVSKGGKVVVHQAFKDMSTEGVSKLIDTPIDIGEPHDFAKKGGQALRKGKSAPKPVALQTDIGEVTGIENAPKPMTRRKGMGNNLLDQQQALESNIVKDEALLGKIPERRSSRLRKQAIPTDEGNTTLGFRGMWESSPARVTRSHVHNFSTSSVRSVICPSFLRSQCYPSSNEFLCATTLRCLRCPRSRAQPIVGITALSSALLGAYFLGGSLAKDVVQVMGW